MRSVTVLAPLILGFLAIVAANPAHAEGASTDKSEFVCAAVFPCDSRFRVLPMFAQATTEAGFFCFHQVYRPICVNARKEAQRIKRCEAAKRTARAQRKRGVLPRGC